MIENSPFGIQKTFWSCAWRCGMMIAVLILLIAYMLVMITQSGIQLVAGEAVSIDVV